MTALISSVKRVITTNVLLHIVLSLQVQLGPIEVLIEISMARWWFGINT